MVGIFRMNSYGEPPSGFRRSAARRGWLRVETRKAGETWVLRYTVTRPSDGKRVEHTKVVGLLDDFPTESTAWAQIERQSIGVSGPSFLGKIAFGDLCKHYLQHEVLNPRRKQQIKAHTTVQDYVRIVTKRLLLRFGQKEALRIQPLEIEDWLDFLQDEERLENPTLDKYRRQMFLVYKHGQRHGLIPRTQEANPLNFVRQSSISNYRAITISATKTFEILRWMPPLERTLTLLVAVTGLRISEAVGLIWQDIDYTGRKIYVRRAWTRGGIGRPKSNASRAPVPLHPILAAVLREWQNETQYAKPADWLFPSDRLRGTRPRSANMLVEDHLRPAAVRAEIPELLTGEKVRFGFHNLRHSLASFLVDTNIDPKTVQELLRQADVRTTLQFYCHSSDATKMMAQEKVLNAILPAAEQEAILRKQTMSRAQESVFFTPTDRMNCTRSKLVAD